MLRDKTFWNPVNLIATWFGAGLLPKVPGTWGAFAALPFAWLITVYGGQIGLFIAALLLFVIGMVVSELYDRTKGDSDSPQIVVDEVVGQWLTLTVAPLDVLYYAAGFLLFRVADILKPWPANKVDRKLKNGFGVMLDDVVAAIYAAIILLAIQQVISN